MDTKVLSFSSNRSAAWPVALLLAAFAVLWFCNLDHRSLVRPDEGRYAEIAREMAATGDWVTPRLNGIKYFEKPPLQYWMTAAAYETFGEREWTARLWTALTGFLGVLATAFVGARLFGARTGLFAGVVLASSLLYGAIGHISTLDMGVTFWLSCGVFAFLLAQSAPAQSGRWMMAAWAAAALAFLSKGLIGLLLPAMALVAYMAIERDFSPLKRLRPVMGLVLFLAIALPWVIAVSMVNPEFPAFFFIHEHFARFLTKEHHRTGAVWYFVPILIGGLLPWTGLLAPAALRAWRADPAASPFKARKFLLIYAGIVFAFFSVSGSKLPSYILPMFPPLALLLGDWLAQADGGKLRKLVLPALAFGVIVAAVAPFATRFATEKVPAELYAGFVPWLLAGGLALVVASLAAWWLARRGRILSAVMVLGGGGLLLVQLVMSGHQALSPSYSAAVAAESVKPLLGPDVPFYSVRTYEQTLPFYIKRTVTLVDYEDELEFGLQQQPELRIASVQEFRHRWENSRQALAIMGPDMYQDLAQQGLPMRLLYRDGRRVIVARS